MLEEIKMDAELEKLITHYAPLVNNIIEGNLKFFDYDIELVCEYVNFTEEKERTASYFYEEDIIILNLASIHTIFALNQSKLFEYILLHEFRHKFQTQEMDAYQRKRQIRVTAEIAESWLKNCRNYIQPLNENGKENPEYFKQSLEFDANVYAYVVMQYKYGDVSCLKDCVPGCYGKDFYEKADEWCQRFREMGI